jgi:hypothetical protein
MHLVDRQSDLFHQHGGVVTAVHFDALEEMSVDEFVTRVVPTLKGDKEHFTVIKDSTREQVLRILGDNVARYHIKDIQDVFFDTFAERLLQGQKISITPNLKYPLIRWVVLDGGAKDITVEIPPTQFEMDLEGVRTRLHMYHPRMWLRVMLTAANAPDQVMMVAVPEHMDDFENKQVYHMPFPNVFDSSSICWGDTSYDVPPGVKLTEAVAIELTYQRFFNSQFNYDLLDDRDRLAAEQAYNELPKIEEYEKLLEDYQEHGRSVQHMLRLARVFTDLESMKAFKFSETMTADRFLGKDMDD